MFVAGTFANLLAGDDRRLAQIPFRVLMMVGLLAVYWWMLAAFDHVSENRLSAMGLPGSRIAWRHSLLGLLLGAAAALTTAAIIAWCADLHVQASLHLHRDLPVFIVEVFIVLASGAMAEELIFRGYPFQRLVDAIGAAGAIVVLSVLFGTVHLRNPNASAIGFVNTIVIGAVFAIAYLRTRTLWLPFGIHWGWNAMLGAVIGLPVSGVDMSVAVHSQALGPAWLTGGSYGPEASIACTIAIGLLLVVIVSAFRTPSVSPDVTSANRIQSV
jgi:membrane protease YdiL (CAAX protease family)